MIVFTVCQSVDDLQLLHNEGIKARVFFLVLFILGAKMMNKVTFLQVQYCQNSVYRHGGRKQQLTTSLCIGEEIKYLATTSCVTMVGVTKKTNRGRMSYNSEHPRFYQWHVGQFSVKDCKLLLKEGIAYLFCTWYNGCLIPQSTSLSRVATDFNTTPSMTAAYKDNHQLHEHQRKF